MRLVPSLLFTLLPLAIAGGCSSEESPAAPGGATPDAAATDGPATDDGGGGGDAGDGGTIPGTPRRGSRLAPRFRESADGFSAFLSIADTGLANAPCMATRAADGVLRCLPSEAAYLSSLLFADAACATRVIDIRSICAKPAFAVEVLDSSTPCAARTDVHDVGAALSGQLYEDQNGACVPIASEPTVTYYTLGAARPATDFVKLTPGMETIGGGIGVTTVDGDDGSHFPQGAIVDVARAKGCFRAMAADAKNRCLPSVSGSVAGYVDDACSKPAALVFPSCDPALQPDTAQAADPANDGRAHVFALGPKKPANETYQKVDPTTCAGPSTTTEDVYEVGAEIPASSFPELGETNEGGTRLVSTRPVAGGIALPSAYGLRDLARDERCSVMPASDGTMRCLPQGATRSFSDDQCTVPIVVIVEGATPSVAIAPDASCPRRFAVYAIGGEIAAPAMSYTNFGGPCVGSTISATAKVHALGAEIPPTSFVEVTEVVR